MSFRFPVTTQEPVLTRDDRPVLMQLRRYNFGPGTLSASNPLVHELTMPTAKQWMLVSVLVRWNNNVDNDQYLTFNIENRQPDGVGNVYFSNGIAMTNPGSNGIVYGHWLLGGAFGSETLTVGAQPYITRHYPLPPVWLDPSSVLEWSFHNATANDTAIIWLSYMERDV